MEELVKENYKVLTKSFVKFVLAKNKKFGLVTTMDEELVNVDETPLEELISRVFTAQ
jgi:hypothetical protein